MGITIVQKSDLSRPRPGARRALVLAGGAISGGAFKVGGLLALNRFLRNFRVTDFDIYVGVSAGAFLAAPLSAGFAPHELVGALRGSAEGLTQFRYRDFYIPAWSEFFGVPRGLLHSLMAAGSMVPLALMRVMPNRRRELTSLAKAFLIHPGIKTAEALTAPIIEEISRGRLRNRSGYLPSGIFDNRGIESYIRRNLDRNKLPNDFRKLKLLTGKSLYIGATDLNTAQGVIFGHDEECSVSVSEAVQASSAIPGFFKPARVGPPGQQHDYIDAAVRKTANISTAVRHGAQLIICYNPFRPFVNYQCRPGASGRRSISDFGMGAILNQAFRTMLYSRLRLGIEKLRLDANFHGDCILIEPAETDVRFFNMNPIAFWRRAEAAAHGYQSVRNSLEKHYEPLRRILAAYGINVDLGAMEGELDAIRKARDARTVFDLMEESRPSHAGLRLVSAGR